MMTTKIDEKEGGEGGNDKKEDDEDDGEEGSKSNEMLDTTTVSDEAAINPGTSEIMSPSSCANCGKGEENIGDLKTCAACKLVKYCNSECQVAHRPQHKRECKQRASEIFDERLFQHPTEKEECPICFLPSPPIGMGMRNSTCCGQVICGGCVFAYIKAGNEVCPFCKQPLSHANMDPQNVDLNIFNENLARYRKQRMDVGDAK